MNDQVSVSVGNILKSELVNSYIQYVHNIALEFEYALKVAKKCVASIDSVMKTVTTNPESP